MKTILLLLAVNMKTHVSLKQLNVFLTITQHCTLTEASEALFLSKAAVSMALSELEKQIGHALFALMFGFRPKVKLFDFSSLGSPLRVERAQSGRRDGVLSPLDNQSGV